MANEALTADRLQPRRWRVLAALGRVESPATVDEIADQLHQRRAPSDPLAGLESWDRVHERLHEVDLPALQMAGLIEYDGERGVVTVPRTAETATGVPDGAAERVPDGGAGSATASDHTSGPGPGRVTGPSTVTGPGGEASGDADGSPAHGDRWRYRYLLAAALAAVLVSGTAMLAPAEPVATTAAAGAVAVLFAALSVVHLLSQG